MTRRGRLCCKLGCTPEPLVPARKSWPCQRLVCCQPTPGPEQGCALHRGPVYFTLAIYTQVHKVMAGLLDQHELAGSRRALGVATRMGSYFARRVERVIEQRGLEHWHRVLDVEFGGMNEVLAGSRTCASAHEERQLGLGLPS